MRAYIGDTVNLALSGSLSAAVPVRLAGVPDSTSLWSRRMPADPNAAEWYARIMGTEFGPLTGEKLRRMAEEGTLTPDAPLRRGGTGPWRTAGELKGLKFPESAGHGAGEPVGADLLAAPSDPAVFTPPDPPPPSDRTETITDFDLEDDDTPASGRRHILGAGLLWGAGLVVVLALIAGSAALFWTNPVQNAVTSYLDQTLHDSDYDIVSWEGTAAVSPETRKTAYLLMLRHEGAQHEKVEQRIRKGVSIEAAKRGIDDRGSPLLKAVGLCPAEKPLHAVRLRFRARNKFGAKVLADRVFLVSGDEVKGFDLDSMNLAEVDFLVALFSGTLTDDDRTDGAQSDNAPRGSVGR